jgi:hypothetical protein
VATTTDVRRLTTAYRSTQVQRAAAVAALVAAYYRSKVDPEDPAAVDRWIDLMLPKILGQHDNIAQRAAAYATTLRRLELPNEPALVFEPSVGAVTEQVRKSLQVVGPGDYLNKMRDIRRLDVSPTQVRALMRDAKDVTARKVMASTVRHVQNGGRQTLVDAATSDVTTIGYVRVTKAKPCFFCAMLASRGLDGGLYQEDSFAASDPRFTGEGTVKVHDECQCTYKPVYTRNDEFLKDIDPFVDMWERWGAGGGDAALRFRRGYDHFMATGEYLEWDVVDDIDRYRARNS